MFKKLICGFSLLAVSSLSYCDILFDFLKDNKNDSKVECIKTVTNICDLYLDESIKTPQDYLGIAKDIRKLTKADTLVLHLVGNGGSGAGLVYLLNAIKSSKVHTIGSLEGSVASAHTILLVASDEIQLNGDGYLLFHSISSSNMVEDICVHSTGKDRGIASYTKCVENITKQMDFYNRVINPLNTKYLTTEEVDLYNKGHDIIIDSYEFKKRLGK